MSHKEILTAAAQAAGIRVTGYDEAFDCMIKVSGVPWDPLRYSWAMLELQAKLRIAVTFSGGYVTAMRGGVSHWEALSTPDDLQGNMRALALAVVWCAALSTGVEG